jgi:hypothetical protein
VRSKNTAAELVARSQGGRSRRSFAIVLIVLLVAVIPVLIGTSGAAQGSTLSDIDATPGAVQPPSKIVGVGTPAPTRPPARWEHTALQALADAMSWPTDVIQGPGGKLTIQLEMSSQEWYQASIRAFETDAGASAALAAEMEDLQMAGLRVAATQFYSYPAYVATLSSEGGELIERRLTWHADEWVMGIAVHGLTEPAQTFDPQAAGRHMLYLAVQQGLPAPPGGVLPPNPQGGTPTAAPTTVNCGMSFEDVPSTHWAAGYIDSLACDGIVSGYADGTFRPQNPTTRAQLTKMLALAEDWELASPAIATFSDVPPTHVFYKYVETAVRKNVVSGSADGRFRPDAYVTRSQVGKMLVESRGWAPVTQAVTAQCDVPRTHWAWAYIHTAIQHGAFRGYANGCFYPDAVATRAQLAKVLVNATR